MICPHYKDVSVYDCKDCTEGLPSPEVQEELSTLRKRISELEIQQQYPTAHAYEKACAALEKHRTRADKAEATLREIRADVRSRFVSPQWDLKNVGTVSHCYICGGNGEEDCEPEHTPSCTLSIGMKEEP